MIRPKLEFLSQETVERAIDEAYELLVDPGLRIHYDEALRLLGDAGAEVDTESRIARIPRTLAEEAVETAPSSFHLYNYDGEPVVHYGPFVMNSMEEIEQAIADYQQGKLV